MKKKFKNIIFIISLITLVQSSLVIAKPFVKQRKTTPSKTFLVLDNDSTTPLPDRFRIIPELNISGSQQFTPSQLVDIIKKINNPNIYIIDLRQEAHGFINDAAVSYHNDNPYQFKCFSSIDTLNIEKYLFGNIELGKEKNIYKVKGELKTTIVPTSVTLEPHLAQINNVKYELFAVRDGNIPTPIVVDSFVEFVKKQPQGSHLHFHCKEGEGRTTTFMVLYQIMHNSNNLTLDAILKQELDAGGINLVADSPRRAEFLKNFYDYVTANKSNNYSVPYSRWVIDQSLAS